MYRIAKQFRFEASHQLTAVPANHKCRRLHGHSYLVEVELATDELTNGWAVRDYGDLNPIKNWIKEVLDHRHLGRCSNPDGTPGVMGRTEPSAENIARFIFDTWSGLYPELVSVTVSETENTWAEYRP